MRVSLGARRNRPQLEPAAPPPALAPLEGVDPRTQRRIVIPILRCDDRYLVINKPHDVRIDGPPGDGVTVEEILIRGFAEPRKIPKLYLVHQLDAFTSGVHLWALSSRVRLLLRPPHTLHD